jgi:hypothetical protein
MWCLQNSRWSSNNSLRVLRKRQDHNIHWKWVHLTKPGNNHNRRDPTVLHYNTSNQSASLAAFREDHMFLELQRGQGTWTPKKKRKTKRKDKELFWTAIQATVLPKAFAVQHPCFNFNFDLLAAGNCRIYSQGTINYTKCQLAGPKCWPLGEIQSATSFFSWIQSRVEYLGVLFVCNRGHLRLVFASVHLCRFYGSRNCG